MKRQVVRSFDRTNGCRGCASIRLLSVRRPIFYLGRNRKVDCSGLKQKRMVMRTRDGHCRWARSREPSLPFSDSSFSILFVVSQAWVQAKNVAPRAD